MRLDNAQTNPFSPEAAPSVETDGRVELDVPTGRQGTFFHTWNMGELDWREGDVLECWFEVWDNDGVHGAKMVRSGTTRIAAPSKKKSVKERNETAESIEENLEEASQEAAELRGAMEAMQERLREQGEMTWQDRQAMEDLMEQQKSLQEKLEQMREETRRKTNAPTNSTSKRSAFWTSRSSSKNSWTTS